MLRTIHSEFLFSAFRLSPGGEVAQFGRPGSGPGKFGVVAGIAADEAGYIYVADRLRSVVLVFDASPDTSRIGVFSNLSG